MKKEEGKGEIQTYKRRGPLMKRGSGGGGEKNKTKPNKKTKQETKKQTN